MKICIIYFKMNTRALKMDSSCNNISMFWLSLSLIFLSIICISSASKTKCLPSENQKWNAKKQKCVDCPECGPGTFRNLTEPYTRRTGEHGAERCIKCRNCPAGTYSNRGYGECSRCRMNCTEFNRETSEPCTRLHDAICGSCLNGYYDMYKNTLFPCELVQPRVLPSRKKPEKKPAEKVIVDKTAKEVEDRELDQDTSDTQPQEGSSKGKTEQTSVNYVSIAISCVAGVVFVALSTGLLIKIMANRVKRSVILNKRHADVNGRYDLVSGQDLSRDNDIEMDTFAHNDQSDAALYLPSQETHFPMTSPRPEFLLTFQLPQQVRAELSQPCQTNQLDGIVNRRHSRPLSGFQFNKDICKCRKNNECHCSTFTFTDDIYIEKSDKYVLKVAENICHDPVPLFSELGLEDSVIYQENSTRERDPDTISEKTLVINLLHKWIEIKSTPTTLRQLSSALCKADFHSINEKLYNLSINNVTLS